jgi:ATP-dependent DNA helicase RecG
LSESSRIPSDHIVKTTMDVLTIKQRIQNTIAAGESHFREFKTALMGPPGAKVPRAVKEISADIAEALVAFANADGGELLIGVEDDGQVTGIPHNASDTDLILTSWKAKIQSDASDPTSHLPILMAQIVSLEAGKVAFFAVGKGTTRIFQMTDGRCVRRKDRASEPANVNHLLFEAREVESRAYDQQFVDGASISDLNLQLIQTVANQILPGMSAEFYLQQTGLGDYALGGLRLRRAALLLFAKHIERWHPRSQIRVIRVSGTELESGPQYNAIHDEQRTGNIFELLTESWDTLRGFLANRTQFGSDARFDQQYLFPEHACREALVNAIAHRAYNIMNPVEIYVFDDRMEIKSPGALLSTVTIEGLLRLQGVHESRNPLIARVLREGKFMRELGEGMRRIFELMEQSEIQAPTLHSDATSFTIALQNRTIYTPPQELWLELFRDYQLTALQKRIVVAGMGDRPLSRDDVIQAMRNHDRDTYDRTVSRLRKLGILIETRTNAAASRIAQVNRIPKNKVHRFRVVIPGRDLDEASTPSPAQPAAPSRATALASPERRVFLQFSAARGELDRAAVHQLFQKCGPIERVDLPMWPSGRQKGFGFVWFELRESAALAVNQINGATLNGQRIVVEAYDTGA